MASDKYFLFRREDITDYSEIFSNNGENLSILAISADNVAYISATKGSVVVVFNDAGLYDGDGGGEREALAKTKVSVGCVIGQERRLLNNILEFITSPNTTRRVLTFDAVTGGSSFKEAELDGKPTITTIIPKQPLVMSTQGISNDPASTDLTQTTTTEVGGITFTSPSLMPIVDYNPAGLSSYALGAEVGQTNHWHNAGTGGSTYDIDDNTGTPIVIGPRVNGTRDKAVQIGVSPTNLKIATELIVEDDYTMYFIVGMTAYFAMGGSIVNDSLYNYFGFAKDNSGEETNSEFYVRHNISTGGTIAKMDTSTTEFDTIAYRFPDPKIAAGYQGVKDVGQSCYVFILRRDKEYNMYLHNHLGDIVGFIPAKTTGSNARTDGDLEITELGTGFGGNLSRFGVIDSDIGGAEASRIAQDMFEKYHYRY